MANYTYGFPIAPIPIRTAGMNHVTTWQEVAWGYCDLPWLWSLVIFSNVWTSGGEDCF